MRKNQEAWDRLYAALPERFAKAAAFVDALSDEPGLPPSDPEPLHVFIDAAGNVWIEDHAKSLSTGSVTYRDTPAVRVSLLTGEVTG